MSTLLGQPADRRTSTRVPHEQPCKVYCPREDRFVAGTTCNLSRGGAMLRLEQCMPVVPGERLRVGMGARRHDALLKVEEMVEAQVLRAVSYDGRTTIAVEYQAGDSLRRDGLRLAA
jgi:hypothetical protein